jgi:hypothetical protein
VFIDEQGDAKFGAHNSTHFALAAVTTFEPTGLNAVLDETRHQLWSESHVYDGHFHAQSDCNDVRQHVYESFARVPITRCDVVSMLKSSAYAQVRTPDKMYGAVLKALLRYVVPKLACDELAVVTAKWPAADTAAIVREAATEPGYRRPVLWMKPLHVMTAPAAVHGGLQYADYLAYAVHRTRQGKDPKGWLELTHAQGRAHSNFVIG